MAAATAINAEAFTNRAMAENNSANCLNRLALGHAIHALDRGTVAVPVKRE